MQARRRLWLEDVASANVVAFAVAAAVFVLGSSFLLNFVIHPPGASVSTGVSQDLKAKSSNALDVLLSTPGYPTDWASSAQKIESVQRLGILSAGSTIRVDPAKLDALAHGLSGSTDLGNGYVDYPQARRSLGLDASANGAGYDFHLKIAPVARVSDVGHYGIENLGNFHVAYIAHQSAPAILTSTADNEAWGINQLGVGYDNSTHVVTGDKWLDDATTLRSGLVPLLGSQPTQTTIATGNVPSSYGFHIVPAAQYSWLFASPSSLTRALALTDGGDAGGSLTYAPGREMRAVLGAANMTGLASATLSWNEWVDTDNDTHAYDLGAYGFVEVSTDEGASWYPLTNVIGSRSAETAATDYPELGGKVISMKARTTTIACPTCANANRVLIGFHWVADQSSGSHHGHGWIIDDVTVAPTATTTFSKTFEAPSYDLVIVGSGVDASALTSSDIKSGLRDFVQLNGGHILALGGMSSGSWLGSLLQAQPVAAAPGATASTDNTAALLNVPNSVDYPSFPKGNPWDFTGGPDASSFTLISTRDSKADLAVSSLGEYGANNSDGAVYLTSWEPGAVDMPHAAAFFANVVTYSAYHALYADMGPAIPTQVPVAAATRTATVDRSHDGSGDYAELGFTLYLWQANDVGATSQSSLTASPPRSLDGEPFPGGATLTWSWPVTNGTGTPQHYNIYRGTASGSYTFRASTNDTNTFSYDDSASNGATYYYKITLVTSAGEGARSREVSVTPSTLPTAPSLDALSAAGQVHLTWTAPLTNGGSELTGYHIYADGGILDNISTNTTYDWITKDTATHAFTVRAVNAHGEGPDSNTKTNAAIQVPGTPIIAAVQSALHTVTVTWTAPGYFPAGSNYTLYASNSPGTETPIQTGNTTRTFTDNGISNGVTRYYRVSATSAAGEGSLSAETSVLVLGVSSAPGLNVTTSSSEPMNNTLSITPPADLGGGTFQRYEIYASTSGTRTLLATLTGAVANVPANTSFVHHTGTTNTTWSYNITAVTDGGYGASSTVESATTPGVPYPPTGLSVTVNNPVTLTWSAPANNGGLSILGYNLYRSANGGAAGTETFLTYMGASANRTWIDMNAPQGNQYYYYVTAVTKAGEGQSSNEVHVHVASVASAPVLVVAATTGEASNMTLTWTPGATNGGTLTAYYIWRGTSSGSLTQLTSTTNTTWKDASLGNNATYYYAISTLTDAGWSANSTVQSATTPGVPYPPTGLTVTTNGLLHTAPVLTWTAPVNTGGLTITGYNVYRNATGGGSGTEVFIGYVTSPTLTDNGSVTGYSWTAAKSGMTYYYWVTAVTKAGEGNHGLEKSGTM